MGNPAWPGSKGFSQQKLGTYDELAGFTVANKNDGLKLIKWGYHWINLDTGKLWACLKMEYSQFEGIIVIYFPTHMAIL